MLTAQPLQLFQLGSDGNSVPHNVAIILQEIFIVNGEILQSLASVTLGDRSPCVADAAILWLESGELTTRYKLGDTVPGYELMGHRQRVVWAQLPMWAKPRKRISAALPQKKIIQDLADTKVPFKRHT